MVYHSAGYVMILISDNNFIDFILFSILIMRYFDSNLFL